MIKRPLYASVALLVFVQSILLIWSTRQAWPAEEGAWSPTNSTSSISQSDNNSDWFVAEEWKACFYVDYLCHQRSHLFYRPGSFRRQPPFILHQYTRVVESFGFDNAYPRTINVTTDSRQCADSPVQNHLLLSSDFNDMLLEFYVRTIVGLHSLTRHLNLDIFRASTQLYVHRQSARMLPMLQSHHLFTEPWRSRPLLDFEALLENTDCECLPRVIFCGYKTETMEGGMHLVPKGSVLPPPRRFVQPSESPTRLQEVRSFLRQRVILERPYVQSAIDDYRRNVTGGSLGKLVVGLAQRNRRRMWLNIELVRQALEGVFPEVVVVDVNLDAPHLLARDHVVRHGALDALIGIHGSGLTDALWMKPGALVVELLPYVPDNIVNGDWTRSTNKPTPLGVIFRGTDLMHVGYMLDRSSAPYCYNYTGDGDCWDISANQWDVRNFDAPPSVLVDILRQFLVSRPRSCGDFQQRAGHSYILYNVNCSDGNVIATPQQFYHGSS